MPKEFRSKLGSYASAGDERLSRQIKIRLGDRSFQRLISLLHNSNDRHDFIRAAIAEKLDRDSIQSRDLT